MSLYQSKFQHIIVKEEDLKDKGILRISLNNPEQRNAITYEMIDSFCSVIEMANIDSQVKVVILTGEGKSFCAGGDIKAMKSKEGMFAGDSFELRSLYENGIQRIPRLLERIEVPLIAAIDGAAVGAGLDLACMCDLRICSDQAKFAESFVKIGLIPGVGGSFFLSRVVGYAKALELALTGKMIDAQSALDLGLVNKVCSSSELMKTANELALEIAQNSAHAVRMTKKAYRQAWGGDLNRHLELLSAYQGIAQRTDDHFNRLS